LCQSIETFEKDNLDCLWRCKTNKMTFEVIGKFDYTRRLWKKRSMQLFWESA